MLFQIHCYRLHGNIAVAAGVASATGHRLLKNNMLWFVAFGEQGINTLKDNEILGLMKIGGCLAPDFDGGRIDEPIIGEIDGHIIVSILVVLDPKVRKCLFLFNKSEILNNGKYVVEFEHKKSVDYSFD